MKFHKACYANTFKDKNKKKHTIGKATLDLTSFAELSGGSTTTNITLKKKNAKSPGTLTLGLKISCESMGVATG